MKLTRTKLRRLIIETLSENRSLADIFYKHAKQAGELEGKVVDFKTAKEHARENGKAYFIQNDDEVTELIRDESGRVNANIINKVPDPIDAQVFMSTYVNI